MPGRCLKCGSNIDTLFNLPALCTVCAGFTSPVQREHLQEGVRAAIRAVPAGPRSAVMSGVLKTIESAADNPGGSHR